MEKSKITKAMVLTAIKEADLTKVDFGAEVTAEDVVAYAEVTLAHAERNIKASRLYKSCWKD